MKHHLITSLLADCSYPHAEDEPQSLSRQVDLFFILKQKLKARRWVLVVDFRLSHMMSFSLLSFMWLWQTHYNPGKVVLLIP